MSNLIPENVKVLLSTYSFKTEDELIYEELMCIICRKLMIDAYQSSCGCKYCHDCIDRYMSEGNEYCQGDKEECLEDALVWDENISRMPQLNKKILKVRVHCPNRPCVFICPLTMMDDHLRVCDHQPMECPYKKIGCDSEPISKEIMETHFQTDGPVHSRLLMEVVDNLRNENGVLKDEVASLKEELMLNEDTRNQLLERLKEEMMMEILEQVEVERTQRMEEKEVMERQLDRLSEREKIYRKYYYDAMKKDLQKHVEEERKLRDKEKEELITIIKTQKQEMMDELAQHKLKSRAGLDNQNMALKRKADTETVLTAIGITKMIKMEPLAVNSLDMGKNEVNVVGRMSFAINEFRDKMSLAGEPLLSPHFYSHTGGYKFRLKVYPGKKSGNHTYLLVYLLICKGENDAVLPWPCKYHVDISVVNQRSKEAYLTETISYCSVLKGSFQRSLIEYLYSERYVLYISNQDLESTDGLIVSDSVLLLATARPPPNCSKSFIVDRFSARKSANGIVQSPYFYSHPNGYKLRIKVHPGGEGGFKGTHLSVYLMICIGEYDDSLPWPCRLSVTVTVVNQKTNVAYINRTVSYCSKYERYFKKPINADNAVILSSAFLSHNDIFTIDGLLVTDSLRLRITVAQV